MASGPPPPTRLGSPPRADAPVRRGGLKGGTKRVGAPPPPPPKKEEPMIIIPGFFHTSPANGINKRGVELDRCYMGGYDSEGRRHGQGTYKYANNFMVYEGLFVHGHKHGLGKLTFKDGGYYEGQFEDDEIQGQGTRRFANGSTWTGSFQMGEMHGPGVLTTAAGDSFEGSMAHNQMQGQGTYRYRNGDVYQGEFQDNRISGQGVMQYANGDRYEGEWSHAKRHGQGECWFANGDNYQGQWENDKFHGEGLLQLPSRGIRYEGLFANGAPTQVPTKACLFWFEVRDEKKTAKKPAAAKGAAPVEEVPMLANTVGTPLVVPITAAAQFEKPLPPEPAADSAVAAAAGAPGSKPTTPTEVKKGAAPPPAVPQMVVTEKPSQGCAWQSAEMESGRVLHLTLHPAPPAPLPAGQSLAVTLACLQLPDGSVRLRVLLTPVKLEKPLPMMRMEGHAGPVHGHEVVLASGSHVFEGLSVGCLEDFDKLQTPTGAGFLVASSWGLAPGYCKVALIDSKAKNPNPPPAAAAGKK